MVPIKNFVHNSDTYDLIRSYASSFPRVAAYFSIFLDS